MMDFQSKMRSSICGEDKVWRGQFVGPGGYIIHASLDMGMTETICRIRGGVEPLFSPGRLSLQDRLVLWISQGAGR